MRPFNISRVIVCCLVACGTFFAATNQVKADLIYTITGVGSNIGDSALVGFNESFTVVLEVDDSVVDANSSSPEFGQYLDAIRSSSISFSGGYSSIDDFVGGDVNVNTANPGGAVTFSSADIGNSLALFNLESVIATDDLVAGSQELATLPLNLIGGLTVQDGSISIFTSSVELTVSSVPEPTSLGLLGLGLVVASVRRRRK